MTDKQLMQRLHADISESLNEIAALFDKHQLPKITLVIRTPWLNDGGVLMGNDDFDEAISEINRLRVKPEVAPAQPPATGGGKQ